MGYGDIGPFGSDIPTPNLDRMAKEGKLFTDFVVTAPVCSSSRAALLTGCYNERLSISGAFFPHDEKGLNPEETTIAELCKSKGYKTACFGKWHLGHHPKFLPGNHGFDEFYGIPYSNDMWPLHPDVANFDEKTIARKRKFPPLPMIQGNCVVDNEIDIEEQRQFTATFTSKAVEFIHKNENTPFFLYVAHPMVHVPIFVSDRFAGKSGCGDYGDVVMELDWSVGQILNAIDQIGARDNTLVVFSSDNGPWLAFGNHAGTTGGLREGKQTIFAGGVRVPTLMRWPGKIPENTETSTLLSTIDLLPTISEIIGAALPTQKIDGKSIKDHLFTEKNLMTPHDFFVFYNHRACLYAIRNEQFKLVFPHEYQSLNGKEGGKDGSPVKMEILNAELALYDLINDPFETTNIIDQQPAQYRLLKDAADLVRSSLGDRLQGIKGTEIRPSGSLSDSDPRLDW